VGGEEFAAFGCHKIENYNHFWELAISSIWQTIFLMFKRKTLITTPFF
jgi:hypothetical protein